MIIVDIVPTQTRREINQPGGMIFKENNAGKSAIGWKVFSIQRF